MSGYRVYLDSRELTKDQAEDLYDKLMKADLTPWWPVIQKFEPENVDKPIFKVKNLKDGYNNHLESLYADRMVVEEDIVRLVKDGEIVFSASLRNVHVMRE